MHYGKVIMPSKGRRSDPLRFNMVIVWCDADIDLRQFTHCNQLSNTPCCVQSLLDTSYIAASFALIMVFITTMCRPSSLSTRNSAFVIEISQIYIIGICKSSGLCRSERNYSAEIRTDHDFIYERGARRLRSTTRTQLRSSKLNEETTQHLPRVITLLKEKRRDDKVLYSIPASALVTRQAFHDFGSSSYSRIA